MADAPIPEAGSLSARAQEILRRADAQLESLRAPARPVALPEPPPEPEPERPADPSRPPEAQDLGGLVDAVQSGVEAAAAHLVTLSEAVERIAAEIEAANEAHRRTLPPGLQGHARLPEELAEPAAPESAIVPDPEPPAESPNAAHDAARLVAIEMAVAGDTREGVGRRLREEFGIDDPRSILDDAFGPDTASPGRGYGR